MTTAEFPARQSVPPRRLLRYLFWPLLGLALASLACRVTVHTDIETDESGTLTTVVEIPLEEDQDPDDVTCDSDSLPPGASIRRQVTGGEVHCEVTTPFANMQALHGLYSDLSEGALQVECLEYDADRLMYAVSLPPPGDDSGVTELEWRVTTSGRIQSHNGHSQEGDSVVWRFDGDSFAGQRMLINLVDPADCPSKQLRLTFFVEEDGTGVAELIGPLPGSSELRSALVADLTGRGWQVDQQASRFVARMHWQDEVGLAGISSAVPGIEVLQPAKLEIVEDTATGQTEYTFSASLDMTDFEPAWAEVVGAAVPDLTLDWLPPGKIETLNGDWTDDVVATHRWSARSRPSRVSLRAVSVVQPELQEQVSPGQVQRNLDEITRIFVAELPSGQVLEDPSRIQSGLLSIFSPGWVNNWTNGWSSDGPAFACGNYQTMVLQWLDRIRTHDDPQVRARLSGLDYGPVQAYGGGHQAVVIYPRGTDWQETGTVLDPWPEQRPLFFPMEDWNLLFVGPKHPGQGSENYPHLFGGDSHYEGTAIPERRQHTRRIGVNSPVYALVQASDGRRLGHLGDGTFVNEIEGADFYTIERQDGTRSYYFGLPDGDYELLMHGSASGDFHLLDARGPEQIMTYGAQPIEPGQQARLPLGSGADPAQLELPSGDSVEALLLDQDNLDRIDLGEPALYLDGANAAGSSSAPTHSAAPAPAVRIAYLALLALVTGGPLGALWAAVVLRLGRGTVHRAPGS